MIGTTNIKKSNSNIVKSYLMISAFTCIILIGYAKDSNADFELATAVEHSWTSPENNCGTSAHAKPSWLDAADAFQARLRQHDVVIGSGLWITTLYENHYHDTDFDPNGYDQGVFDSADVGMLLTHGSNGSSSGWHYGAMMSRSSGTNDCSANQDYMVYGDLTSSDGDLEVLILPGCNGLHYCLGWKWNYEEQLHTINALHGSSFTTNELDDHMIDFVDDGFYQSISQSWWTNMHYDVSDLWNCPVSIARHIDHSGAYNFLYNEQFDSWYSDAANDNYGLRVKYSSCDPGAPGDEDNEGDDYYSQSCSSKSATMGNDKLSAPNVVDINQIKASFYDIYERLLNVNEQGAGSEYISLESLRNEVGMENIDEKSELKFGDSRISVWIAYYDEYKITPEEFDSLYEDEDIAESLESGVCDETSYLYKKSLRKDAARGRVVFVDNKMNTKGEMADDEEVENIAWDLYDKMGLPRNEVEKIIIDHLEEDLQDKKSDEILNITQIATAISFVRSLNGLRFDTSKYLLFMGPGKQIQKLDINWPTLSFPENIKIKSWSDIEEEIKKGDNDVIKYWFTYSTDDSSGVRKYVPTLNLLSKGTYDVEGNMYPGNIVQIPLTEKDL
jgi:hypothetical protein